MEITLPNIRPVTALFTVSRPAPTTPQVTPQVTGQVAGQVAGQVSEEVRRVMLILTRELSRQNIQNALLLRDRTNFEDRYLKPAAEGQWIEMTIPDKPKSRLQKYRLTPKGRAWLSQKPKQI